MCLDHRRRIPDYYSLCYADAVAAQNESDTPAGVSFRQSFRHVNHIKHQETYTIRTQPPSHDLINSTFSFFFFSLSSGIYVAFWPFVGKS